MLETTARLFQISIIIFKTIKIMCLSDLKQVCYEDTKASVSSMSIRSTTKRSFLLQLEAQSSRLLAMEIKRYKRGMFVSLMSLILLLKQVHFGKCALELHLPHVNGSCAAGGGRLQPSRDP